MGLLKGLPRSGWLLLGESEPETVAEHSFRAAIIGLILSAMEGADIGRTVSLCLMHDSPESRVADIPNVGRAYVNTLKAETVSNHQTASMPSALSTLVRDLIQEYEAGDTTEAQLARDADKIETLLQAREYKAQTHYSTDAWEETSIASIRGCYQHRPRGVVATLRAHIPRTQASISRKAVRAIVVPDNSRRGDPSGSRSAAWRFLANANGLIPRV